MADHVPAAPVGDGAPEIEVTEEMIEAGVDALQRRGICGDAGESMDLVRQAVEEAFLSMASFLNRPSHKL